MMRFALVQSDLGAALHVGIQQPVDDEQRPFDPANFAQCDGKLMLSGIGCKFPQQLAWGHYARHHCGRAAQDVGPVRADDWFPDLSADQARQLFRAGGRIEQVKALGWQVPDARDGNPPAN